MRPDRLALALDLLGRHVGRRPDQAPGASQALEVFAPHEAEVRQARPPLVVDQDVPGLDVAVHEARFVDVG